MVSNKFDIKGHQVEALGTYDLASEVLTVELQTWPFYFPKVQMEQMLENVLDLGEALMEPAKNEEPNDLNSLKEITE